MVVRSRFPDRLRRKLDARLRCPGWPCFQTGTFYASLVLLSRVVSTRVGPVSRSAFSSLTVRPSIRSLRRRTHPIPSLSTVAPCFYPPVRCSTPTALPTFRFLPRPDPLTAIGVPTFPTFPKLCAADIPIAQLRPGWSLRTRRYHEWNSVKARRGSRKALTARCPNCPRRRFAPGAVLVFMLPRTSRG